MNQNQTTPITPIDLLRKSHYFLENDCDLSSSIKAADRRRQRSDIMLQESLYELGSPKQQAVILNDAFNSEYFQKILHHTGLPIAKDKLFHSQIATQYYKQIERCSEKISKRG